MKWPKFVFVFLVAVVEPIFWVLSMSTLSPCRPGGILACKLEGASFWEKTPGADYLPHQLTLPEGTWKAD